MADDRSSMFIGAALATAAVAGATYYLTRRDRSAFGADPSVIPIFTPMIDLYTVDDVFARMERIRGDEVTLVLHTPGGCVASCVMIADALAQFRRRTAIVPYLALSGGTLIALAADNIAVGRRAALSAVDPVVHGQRARHIEAGDEAGRHAMAQEYYKAVQRQLRGMLTRHLGSGPNLERALAVFMGLDAPHVADLHAAARRARATDDDRRPGVGELRRFAPPQLALKENELPRPLRRRDRMLKGANSQRRQSMTTGLRGARTRPLRRGSEPK